MTVKDHLHILLVADGRSPTTLSWIRTLQALEFTVSLVSTYPCKEPGDLDFFSVLPVAFGQFASQTPSANPGQKQSFKTRLKKVINKRPGLFSAMRYCLGPISVNIRKRQFVKLFDLVHPDLVHALRIPYEGMLASSTPQGIPLVISTWGNDLTLHAGKTLSMTQLTRACLFRADGLMSDTRRDILLAKEWGFDKRKPSLHVPGSGGLDLDAINSTNAGSFDLQKIGLEPGQLLAINSRGYRPGSVHQDVFIKAVNLVRDKLPGLKFVCPGLAGGEASGWVEQCGIRDQVIILPLLSQSELWALNKQCILYISPSSHDGTPNSLLEAMACGCFPIAGDIPSMREWITPGENGLLVDPQDPQALADAILLAASSPGFREQAARFNRYLVITQASRTATMPGIRKFYLDLLH